MTCPICREPSAPKYRPFCSRRCADSDLAKWLNGSYSTPSTDPDDIEKVLDALEDEPQGKPH